MSAMTQNIDNIFAGHIENYPCKILPGNILYTEWPLREGQIIALYESPPKTELVKMGQNVGENLWLLADPPYFDYDNSSYAVVQTKTEVEISGPGEYSFIYGATLTGEHYIGDRDVLRFDLCRDVESLFDDWRVTQTDLSNTPGNRAIFIRNSHGIRLNVLTVTGKHPMTLNGSQVFLHRCDTSACSDALNGHATLSCLQDVEGTHFAIEPGSGDPNYTLTDKFVVCESEIQNVKCVGPSEITCSHVNAQNVVGISTPWGDPTIEFHSGSIVYPEDAPIENDCACLVPHELEADKSARGFMLLNNVRMEQHHKGPGRTCVRAVLKRGKGFIALNNCDMSHEPDIQYAEAM